MKPFLPSILLVLFFLFIGGLNIFNRWQSGELIRSVDYLIPIVLPLGILFFVFISALVKLSIRTDKKSDK